MKPYQKKIEFLCDQLTLCCTESHGQRYSAELMQSAIELKLRSRNCYNVLRKFLSLPSRNTLRKYFGKLDNPESIDVCREVISNVFAKFEGYAKYCFISADEMHVKPSLQI